MLHCRRKAGSEADIVELYYCKGKESKIKKGAGQWRCVGAGILGPGLATVHRTTLKLGVVVIVGQDWG